MCHGPVSQCRLSSNPNCHLFPIPAHFSIHIPSLPTPTPPQLTELQTHQHPLLLQKSINLRSASGLLYMLFPFPGMLVPGLASRYSQSAPQGTPCSVPSDITCPIPPRPLAQCRTILFHTGAPDPHVWAGVLPPSSSLFAQPSTWHLIASSHWHCESAGHCSRSFTGILPLGLAPLPEVGASVNLHHGRQKQRQSRQAPGPRPPAGEC